MNALTTEWVEKAESDYRAAQGLLPAIEPSGFVEAVCFHSQQCVEKYAKAFLQEHDIPSERADSRMEPLYSTCVSIEPDFGEYRGDFERLDDFGIEILYPGYSATTNDAREAMDIVTRFRTFIRSKLSLDQPSTSKGA